MLTQAQEGSGPLAAVRVEGKKMYRNKTENECVRTAAVVLFAVV